MKPSILALDLEGTLISNAISQIPRPGLHSFLTDVKSQFDQLVFFTTVPEYRVRSIAELLVREGSAPDWFAELRYVRWSGGVKDLAFVSQQIGEALLLDDHGVYVKSGQENLWVEVALFDSPYPPEDDGLKVAYRRLTERVAALSCENGPEAATGAM